MAPNQMLVCRVLVDVAPRRVDQLRVRKVLMQVKIKTAQEPRAGHLCKSYHVRVI